MRLLIVDDEPLILNGLIKVVRKIAPEGTEIREALNAFEGIKVMQHYMPDVTITDINMPEKNGFEMIEEARSQGLCSRFIILTGYDEFEYVRTALRTGVVDYILKPIDQDEIGKLLESIKKQLPSTIDADYTRHASRIVNYIQVHFRKDLSLDHISGIMNLHPNYICSLFKKEIGETFVNYLNAMRIREAQKLLANENDYSVSTIGEMVGYDNKHYFTKVFKRYTGITPSEFRKNALEENRSNER